MATGGSNPPRASNTNNRPLVYQQNKDIVDMPNVASAVITEIKRLELQIIQDLSSMLSTDYADYRSIDYFPQGYNDAPDAPSTNANLIEFAGIVDEVKRKINLGNPLSSTFNYMKYLEFFKVKYNSDGTPQIKFVMTMLENSVMDFGVVQYNVRITRSNNSDATSRWARDNRSI